MKSPRPHPAIPCPESRTSSPPSWIIRHAAALLFLLAGITARAQSQNLIENGDFSNEMTGWHVYSHLPSKKPEASVVSGPDKETSALRVTIPENPELKKYQVGFSQPINHEFAITNEVTLRFMARSPQSLSIGAMLHTVKEPHRNKFYKDFQLTPEWETYEFTGKKPVAFATGEAMVEFFLSFAPGDVEITKIELISGE